MNGQKKVEIAVIGGGIVGCSTAYYIAKAGMDCMIIEKNDIGSGTSSRCDGNVSIVDKDPGFDSQMSWKSQELITELSKELELPFEYRDLGSILVCDNDEEAEAAYDWVKTQRESGLKFNYLEPKDVKRESPYFADDIPGGLECETDSLINPYLFCYSLVHKAKQFGLKVKTQAEVTNVTKDQSGDFIIETSSGTVIAKKVVNAAGVWAPFIAAMSNIDIPIKPRKGHIMVASRSNPVMLRNVMEFGYLMNKFGRERQADELTTKHGVALVLEPTDSQNFLLGSSREFVGYDDSVSMSVVRTLARRALRFFPTMNDFNMIRTYTGFRPFTADHLPIVSEVDSLPNYYIAAGHEGDGISMASATGKLMEEIIQNKTETIVPKEPLDFKRFQDKTIHS